MSSGCMGNGCDGFSRGTGLGEGFKSMGVVSPNSGHGMKSSPIIQPGITSSSSPSMGTSSNAVHNSFMRES